MPHDGVFQEREVKVDLSEVIETNFDGFLDLLVAKGWQEYALVSEINYEVVRAEDASTLVIRVTGYYDEEEG